MPTGNPERGRDYNPYEERVPQPDPTRLTNAAFDRAADQFRREVEQLKELLTLRMDSRDKMLDERYDTQTKALDAALLSAKEASSSAAQANEKRFADLAALIRTLSDQISDMLPRQEYNTAHSALDDKVVDATTRFTALELRLSTKADRGEGKQEGAESVAGTGYQSAVLENAARTSRNSQLIASVSVAVVVIGIIISVLLTVGHH